MKHRTPKTKILTIVLLPLASLLLAKGVIAETLTTPSFRVTITRHCPEGYVTCNDVTYDGSNLNTGASLRLRGKTVHTTCGDGVTPCRFLGYEFRNRDYRYVVLEDGRLQVYQGRKLLRELPRRTGGRGFCTHR